MESKRCSSGTVKTCRLHDMLRDLCLKKSREDNFIQLISMSGSNDSKSPKDKKLYDVSSIIEDFHLVRVLDLEPIQTSNFPRAADMLLFLNYLAIKRSMKSVPSSIANLRNLEILIVKGTWGEIALPSTLWSIATLRHVHIRPSASLTLSIPEIENAMIWQNLVSFSCPAISDWNDIKKTLKRWIGLQNLRCIFLEMKYWDGERRRYVFLAMEFLTQLESLNVSYMGKTFPCKFSFPPNLKKLTLSSFCFAWDYMSVIIQLSKLGVLKLLFRAVEGDTWDMTEKTIFNKLKHLKLVNLNIANWNNSLDCKDHFPELEKLVFWGCRKLGEVPSTFGEVPTLQMIEMQLCSKSAEHSVKEIFEQQLEYNNLEFKVIINPSQSIAERFLQMRTQVTLLEEKKCFSACVSAVNYRNR